MPEPKTNLAYDLLAIDIDGTLADSKGRGLDLQNLDLFLAFLDLGCFYVDAASL